MTSLNNSGTSASRVLNKRRFVIDGAANMDPTYSNWESFIGLWERANLIRSFIWSQESADETALFTQFLVRLRRFFKIDFCFIALQQEDEKTIQKGVPETLLDQLPVDFVRRSMDLVAASRIPIAWKQLHTKTGFRTVVVSPLSPTVGQPLGFLMLGHLRNRHFTKAELFLLQSLAGEVSWAVRELRSKRSHHKRLAVASLELKNSLNMVLAECSLLREIEEEALPADRSQRLLSIERNTQETLRTICSFLDTRIAGEGSLTVPRENIDLAAVMEDTLLPCRDKAKAIGLELQAHYADDLPREYSTDPARFRHMLRNLADHAIDASEQSPVLICARRNSEFIEFKVQVSKPRPTKTRYNPATDPAVCGQLADECGYDRMEVIRENIRLLNGHSHFVKRPGEGFEISICLPEMLC
jgi:signal transduction histidine kinase